jgi:hypothetical protein
MGARTMVVGDIDLTHGAALYRGLSKGKHWYIAQSDYGGNDLNSGRSFESPFATWTKVMDSLSRGDVIHLYGEVKSKAAGEVTPAGVTDVAVIGHGGRRPRHGTTSIPTGPKGGSAEWSHHASATGPALTVTQQGWSFENILFAGNSAYPIIKLERDDSAGTAADKSAGHAQFVNCVFVGPCTYGIQESGGNPNVGIYGCNFYGFTTAGNRAIGAITGTGDGYAVQWQIYGNRFQSNERDIDFPAVGLMGAEIVGNHFKLISGIVSADFTNTIAYNNVAGEDCWIAHNHMHAASNHAGVNARFVPGNNDMFAENYWSDVAEYGEPTS